MQGWRGGMRKGGKVPGVGEVGGHVHGYGAAVEGGRFVGCWHFLCLVVLGFDVSWWWGGSLRSELG